MIQGPQPDNQAFSGVAQRLLNPAGRPDPELLASATGSHRFAQAAEGVARTEKNSSDETVTVFTRAGNPEAIAKIETQGLRAELVRAEIMLQIAQEAFTAIEILYGGMQELAVMALDEDLTVKQRIDLDAAFQELKQDVKDIINATVFDGEHLLKGGDGHDGAYVIRLSSTGEAGEPFEILIPSASIIKEVELLESANLLALESIEATVEAARATVELSGMAAEIFQLHGDVIESHRASLQRIFSTQFGPGQSLSDYVESFESPKYAEGLHHLVADLVLAGGKVPFEDSADRLRDILERTIDVARPSAAPTLTNADPAPSVNVPPRNTGVNLRLGSADADGNRPSHSLMGDLVRADKVLVKAENALQSLGRDLSEMRRLAENVADAGADSGPRRKDWEDFFHHRTDGHDIFAKAMEVHGEKILVGGDGPGGDYILQIAGGGEQGGEGGDGFDVVIPSMLATDQLPGLVDVKIPTPEAALAAIDRIDVAIGEVARRLEAIGGQHSLVHQRMSAVMPGGVSPAQVVKSLHGSDDDQLAMSLSRKVPHEADLVITQELRDQVRRAVQDAEIPKIREIDAVRRAPGLVQMHSDPDAVRDAGVSLRSTFYEAPADQEAAFGQAVVMEQGGFLGELVRADNMLQVADRTIEQIDLNLDYMRGLAEEAAGDSSRYRIVLNEIFQVVKMRIVDPLAQSAEAQGQKILAGGDGPDGEFVIHLSKGIVAGEAHDIAIPSMLVKDLSSDLFYADIRTREAAMAAVDHIEFASENAANARDMIAEQRTLIRRLMSINIGRNNAAA